MRPPDVTRLTLGVLALARPELPVRLTGTADGTGVRRAVRVLGARYVLQAVGGLWLDRERWLPRADAAVDLAHAGSMLGLARLEPSYRRLALLSATLAAALAAADLTGRRNA